jgi:VWFA-related protein
MARVLLLFLAVFAVSSVAPFGADPEHAAPATQSRSRAVYVTALDESGASITDLTAAELVVKEGGKPRRVTGTEPATARLQIAIIVDDNGSGLFRAPVAQFLNRLLDYGDFGLRSITGQVQKLVGYTHDVAALRGAIDRLGPRAATPDGGQLLEAISDSARELRQREAGRPVIVALTVGGDEQSPLTGDLVLDQLRDSRAILYVVSVASSAIRTPTGPTRPADLLDAPLNLGQVLGDGPKQSGGRHEQIVAAPGLVPGLQRIADELVHQYVVTYEVPEGAKSDERLSVSTTRKGITLRAPSRIPVK